MTAFVNLMIFAKNVWQKSFILFARNKFTIELRESCYQIDDSKTPCIKSIQRTLSVIFASLSRSIMNLFLANVIIFCVFISHCYGEKTKHNKQNLSSQLPNVTVVLTGGTILEVNNAQGVSVPATSVEDILNVIPEIKHIANIHLIPFSNIDSSQMTPELWKKLSVVVNEAIQNSDTKGVVVVHGTDTMAEGAYFLDLTVNTNKPVVFVGAMRNASNPYSDGPLNLINAITQVVSDNSQNWGVTVTLNNYIHSARFVRKTESTNVQAFSSGNQGILGYIVERKILRVNNRSYREILPIPKILPKIDLIEDYSGFDGSFIRYAADHGADGIVVDGFGSGNVNAEVFKAIEYAINKGIAVVITTRVFSGGVFPLYGDLGGGKSLQEAGAIVAGDLPAPKARLLLMLTLPQVNKNHSLLKKYFTTY